MIGPLGDDRGVSIAVNHVLTIGITTILITGLLVSAGTMLDSEQNRSADRSLETIGERLAGEISHVDRLARDDANEVRLTVKHPSMVASQRYSVTILEDSTCDAEAPLLDGSTDCLRLETVSGNVDVYVPIGQTDSDLDHSSSISGGVIDIVYDGDKITLERGS